MNTSLSFYLPIRHAQYFALLNLNIKLQFLANPSFPLLLILPDPLLVSPQPRDLSGGQAEVTTQLMFSLPQPLNLSLGSHILSEQLQLVHLQPSHLLGKIKLIG